MTDQIKTADQKRIAQFLGEMRPFKDGMSMQEQQAHAKQFSNAVRKNAGGSSQKNMVRAAAGYKQGFIKVIRNGGAKQRKGMQDQAHYLTRKGTLSMHDSPIGEYDGELSADELKQKMTDWTGDFKGRPKLGHTTHMVVSFPPETDREAAHEAALEFGRRAFCSNTGGDNYDWMAVTHDDTDHPHTHFVIKNRGEQGGWFSIRRDGPHDVNYLRELQVEVAAEYGIELAATRRIERGEKRIPPNSTAYNQSVREDEEVLERFPTGIEKSVIDHVAEGHARAYDALAATYADIDKEIEALLKEQAKVIRSGEPAMADRNGPKTLTKENKTNIDTIDAYKTKLSDDIDRADDLLAKDTDPQLRVVREIKIAQVKQQAAHLLPERDDLRPYAEGQDSSYQVNATWHEDKRLSATNRKMAADHYRAANEAITAKANEEGLDAGKLIARYTANEHLPAETARTWKNEEVAAVKEDQPDLSTKEARETVAKVHDFAKKQYEDANREIEHVLKGQGLTFEPQRKAETENERNDVAGISPADREAAIQDAFTQSVKNMERAGMPASTIGGHTLEMTERAEKRISENPELISMSKQDRRQFEAFESNLTQTQDFLDGSSQDAKLVKDRQKEFSAIADKSPAQAQLASRAWDKLADNMDRPAGHTSHSKPKGPSPERSPAARMPARDDGYER